MKRRTFIRHSAILGSAAGFQTLLPAWAQSGANSGYQGVLADGDADLVVEQVKAEILGKRASHITLNGQFPAPLLRWQEGREQVIRVHNKLDEDTSIHWHGLLLPYRMDGVPGVAFPGILPGEVFEYRFPVMQSGTYWYHSHSGLQEQLGHYGPIIINPADTDPVEYDREYVVMLSDWTFEKPERVFSKLKKMSDTYNFQQRTWSEFLRDVEEQGLDAAMADRMMWGDMRMNPTDLSDVTGATYTYLVNGHSPAENWRALFSPGEKVRLRFINASAMTLFNVRIPGLPMTVVQADGLNVQPVETDEFQIGTAETFDVVVQPHQAGAWTIMAETHDRSGYAAATLTSDMTTVAPVPALRERPLLTMKDMGMGNMSMDEHGSMDHDAMTMPNESGSMDQSAMSHSAMDDNTAMMTGSGAMVHEGHDMTTMPGTASCENSQMQQHNHPRGPGVANVAMYPLNRLHERPMGLENESHRVLVYTDLKSLQENPDKRPPGRELELHLTSNMERYMWSFDGIKFSEVDGPIIFNEGERLRVTLVNDTMMPHPIHLHGMFFDVVTRDDGFKPRKHTIVVKPGEKLSWDVTADAVGEWAFHCHLLYHMAAGMMRVVSVRPGENTMPMHDHQGHEMSEMDHGQHMTQDADMPMMNHDEHGDH